FNLAVDRRLLDRNAARNLKAKSRKRRSNLSHSLEECDALYAQVSGRDHLAIRILVQLGLRSEEFCALRPDDVRDDQLVIDEAVVSGHTKDPKALASPSSVYIPPDLATELQHYLETIHCEPKSLVIPVEQQKCADSPREFSQAGDQAGGDPCPHC